MDKILGISLPLWIVFVLISFVLFFQYVALTQLKTLTNYFAVAAVYTVPLATQAPEPKIVPVNDKVNQGIGDSDPGVTVKVVTGDKASESGALN